MNENKKEYEVGYVDITTEEYKDIITQMVENRKDAEYERSHRWKAEDELKLVKEELEEVKKELRFAQKQIEEFRLTCEEVTNNA